MNLLEQNILKAAEEVAGDNGFFLIDMILRGVENSRVIEIFIDGENYISADECAKIGSELNYRIQNESLINSDYHLEVSSPGVNRPLKYLKQFPKHLNKKFEISYKLNNETKKIIGKLVAVDGDNLVFSVNNNDLIINFCDILKAKVLISFS